MTGTYTDALVGLCARRRAAAIIMEASTSSSFRIVHIRAVDCSGPHTKRGLPKPTNHPWGKFTCQNGVDNGEYKCISHCSGAWLMRILSRLDLHRWAWRFSQSLAHIGSFPRPNRPCQRNHLYKSPPHNHLE